MSAQFLLNLFIALLWMLLQDENAPSVHTFLVGFLVGIGIVFLMHRFFGQPFYLRRFFSAIKLVLIFMSELLQSSLLGAKRSNKTDNNDQSRHF